MSQTKNLILLLDACEKKEFDQVVKAYLREEYDFKKIVFTDSKDDTGLDIKVFDYNSKTIQYQLTTQKSKDKGEKLSFEQKLKRDLSKAKENVGFGYTNKLLFFYSKTLSNKQIREYEKMAFNDFGIDLEIIEANRIAEESENIFEIQIILYKLNELDNFQVQFNEFNDKNENLILDLVSFGKPSEFKVQIIESFILQSIFLEGHPTKEHIVELCIKKFSVQENEVFYDKLLNRLQSSKKILKNSSGKYTLIKDEYELLKKKNAQHDIDQQLFIKEIASILYKYKQLSFLSNYVDELKRLYAENFNTDLNDLLDDPDASKLYGETRHFLKFIEGKIGNDVQAKELAKELLRFCISNKFIQKIAASKVYCESINYNRLQNYLNTQKKIFIDTQIALHGLCYYYKPHSKYENYFFRSSKNLIQFCQNEKMRLNISERYIWEVQNHIKEAFNILPFTRLPNFRKLGSSRNVFYNFFGYLTEHDEVEDGKSFESFLKDFGFQENISTRSINSKIEVFLSEINIDKQQLFKEYVIYDVDIMFITELQRNKRFKTKFTRMNDAIMVEFLADKDVDIHPLKPIFVTWDKTFFEVHSQYQSAFPSSQQWLITTPSKLVDVYAILKFSINGETVTENLLAYISDDIISNAHSLLDTIMYVLNPHDEISLEYASRLGEIRDKEINQINSNQLIPPDTYEGEAVIDDVFYNLTTHYQEEENKLELFKKIFTSKELINDVIDVLTKTVREFYSTKKLGNSIFSEFDKFISSIAAENK